MKRYLLLSTILLAALSMTSLSCKKDSDAGKSRANLILGTWVVTGSGADENNNNILEPAERNAALTGFTLRRTYNAGGSGGAEVMVSGQLFSKTPFTWSLTDNDQTLRMASGSTDEVVITLLTETQLAYYEKGSNPHQLTILTR